MYARSGSKYGCRLQRQSTTLTFFARRPRQPGAAHASLGAGPVALPCTTGGVRGNACHLGVVMLNVSHAARYPMQRGITAGGARAAGVEIAGGIPTIAARMQRQCYQVQFAMYSRIAWGRGLWYRFVWYLRKTKPPIAPRMRKVINTPAMTPPDDPPAAAGDGAAGISVCAVGCLVSNPHVMSEVLVLLLSMIGGHSK